MLPDTDRALHLSQWSLSLFFFFSPIIWPKSSRDSIFTQPTQMFLISFLSPSSAWEHLPLLQKDLFLPFHLHSYPVRTSKEQGLRSLVSRAAVYEDWGGVGKRGKVKDIGKSNIQSPLNIQYFESGDILGNIKTHTSLPYSPSSFHLGVRPHP